MYHKMTILYIVTISGNQDVHKLLSTREDLHYLNSNIKNEMELTSQRKDASPSVAHLEYLRALTKHYQQQNVPPANTHQLAAYQELLLQQQKQNHQQQQFLQLNQRRSMEDVLKKLASVGKDGIDLKGNKSFDCDDIRLDSKMT